MLTRRQALTSAARAVAGASLLGLTACARSEWDTRVADLERRLPGLMADVRLPGLSIALIRDARIAWHRGFGVRDQRSRQAVGDDTVFEAQSMSKPVFAYRVMKLCELGIMDLDVPLTRYTPERLVEDDARLELVTARRVLSHTTGLPNWRSTEEPLRFNFTPGERWMYSGEGYSYLQSVVTRLTGHSDPAHCGTFELGYRVCASDFGDDMTANLLAPFGMTSSGYVWTEAIGRKMASPHDKDGTPTTRPKSTAAAVARYGSAAALLSTATDFAKFLIEVMNPRPADAFRLDAATRAEMLRPQIEVPDSPIPASWALGWQVWRRADGNLIAHGGDIDGFHSQSMFSPDRHTGFVIMTNGDGGSELIWKRLLADLLQFV